MRQAPRYLIIGDGCLANHLVIYFKQLGLDHAQWSRRTKPFDLSSAIHQHSHIIVALSDRAISGFVTQHDLLTCDARIIHCSACVDIQGVDYAHPLMTFAPKQAYELHEYAAIPFTLDSHGPDLPELMPGLPNPFVKIPQSKRHRYHALCTLSGNLTALLWKKFFDDMTHDIGIDKKHLQPYFNQVHHNILHHPKPMTGPLIRGDHDTILAHHEALKDDSFLPFYQNMCDIIREEHHDNIS